MSEAMNSRDPLALPAELAEVERGLVALRPAMPESGARDALLYHAGQAAAWRAGRQRLRLWQGACAMLLLACTGLTMGQLHGTDKSALRPLAKTPATSASQPKAVATVDLIAAPPAPILSSGGEDDWAGISLPELQPRTFARMPLDEPAGGGSADVPALRKADGLDALPAWQRRALTKGNNS